MLRGLSSLYKLVPAAWEMGMSPQPQSVAVEISQQRLAMWDRLRKTHAVDEVAIKRLQNRITGLLEKPTIGLATKMALYHELGCLLSYQGKLGDALHYLDSAGRLGLPEPVCNLSRGHMLWLNGEVSEMRSVLERIELSNDLAFLHTLTGELASGGMFSRARKCIHKLVGKIPSDSYLCIAADILDENQIQDSEVGVRLQTAADVLKGRISHPFLAYEVFADRDEGISFSFVVNVNVEEVVELDRCVVEALVEKYDGPVDSLLAINVKPFEPAVTKDTYGTYHVGV
jgi:hypothetical protein